LYLVVVTTGKHTSLLKYSILLNARSWLGSSFSHSKVQCLAWWTFPCYNMRSLLLQSMTVSTIHTQHLCAQQTFHDSSI